MNVRGPAQRRRARSPRVASSRGTPDEPVSRGAQAPTEDPLPWAGEPAAAVGRWDRRLGQPRANPIGRATIESCGHARGSGQQGGVSRSVLDLLGAWPRARLVRLAGLGRRNARRAADATHSWRRPTFRRAVRPRSSRRRRRQAVRAPVQGRGAYRAGGMGRDRTGAVDPPGDAWAVDRLGPRLRSTYVPGVRLKESLTRCQTLRSARRAATQDSSFTRSAAPSSISTALGRRRRSPVAIAAARIGPKTPGEAGTPRSNHLIRSVEGRARSFLRQDGTDALRSRDSRLDDPLHPPSRSSAMYRTLDVWILVLAAVINGRSQKW